MRYQSMGNYDQRRRRMLREEHPVDMLAGDSTYSELSRDSATGVPVRLRAYSTSDSVREQIQFSAVLPSRILTIALTGLFSIAVTSALLAAYHHLHQFARADWPFPGDAFDLKARGNLASWFASLLWGMAAFQGIQIYRIRRHRQDDYRGRYRMWWWMPGLLFCGAVCAGTSVHRELLALIGYSTSLPLMANEHLVTPLIGSLLWLAIGLRLGLEVRPSRLALTMLILASASFCAGTVLKLVELPTADALTQTMVLWAAQQSASLGVFLCISSYGRHVLLDLHGMVPAVIPATRNTSHESEEAVTTLSISAHRPDPEPISSEPLHAEPEPELEVRSTDQDVEPEDQSVEVTAVLSMDRTQNPRPTSVHESSGRSESAKDGVSAASEDSDEEELATLSKAERRRRRKQKRRERARQAA